MAHSCPECDETCYCGGDIDDVLMPDEEAENGCTHCAEGDRDPYGEDDYFDYSEDADEWIPI